MSAWRIPKQAQDLKLKAAEAYAAMKWKKALELYLKVADFLPDDPKVGQRCGDLCRRLNRFAEAAGHYKNVASIYARDGFWAKAIAMTKVILEVDPSDTSVQSELARYYSAHAATSQSETTEPIFRSKPRPEAVSLAAAEPRTLDEPPRDESWMGSTVSLPRGDPGPDADSGTQGADRGVADESALIVARPAADPKRIPLFSRMNPDELAAVMKRLAIRTFPEGAVICREGDEGRSMYVIAEGRVEVSVSDENGGPLLLAVLEGCDFFGEFGLLTDGRRNASVTAVTDVELLEITASDFDVIGAAFPGVWVVLEEHLRQRMIDNILKRSSVFRVLSEAECGALTEALSPIKAEAGREIMAEGTQGDEMFFVKRGTLSVIVDREGDRVVVGELHPGDYFGEVAMLTGRSRTATVLARTECELFALKRPDAARILRNNREVLLRLRDGIKERANEAIEAFRSHKEAKVTLALV